MSVPAANLFVRQPPALRLKVRACDRWTACAVLYAAPFPPFSAQIMRGLFAVFVGLFLLFFWTSCAVYCALL